MEKRVFAFAQSLARKNKKILNITIYNNIYYLMPNRRINLAVDAHGHPSVRGDAGGEVVGAASRKARIRYASLVLPLKTWGRFLCGFRSLAVLVQP